MAGRAARPRSRWRAATLFALAASRGVRAATLLLVTDLLFPARVRIGRGPLRDGERRMGEIAVAALTAAARSGSG